MKTDIKNIKVDKNYRIISTAHVDEYSDKWSETIDFILKSAEDGKISVSTRDVLLKLIFNKILLEEKKNVSKIRSIFNVKDTSSLRIDWINNKKQYV